MVVPAASVLHHLPDVVLVLDASGVIVSADGDLGRYGWTVEDVVGTPILDHVHADDLAQAAGTFAAMAGAAGTFGPVEVRGRRADGTYASGEMLATNRLDDPEVGGIVMVIRDISERRAAEWARHEREAEYQRIVELSQEGLWTIDPEGRTTYVNPRMAAMLGHDPAAMIGRSFFEYMDDEGRRLAAGALERRRQGISERYDSKFVHRDGRSVWVMMATTPLTLADGSFAGSLAVMTDVTARRSTERSLRMSEQRFRLAQEHAPIGLAIVGLDGRWLQVNPALCAIVERSENDLLAVTFQEMTHPDDLAADLGHLSRLLAGEIRSYELDKRYLRPDGSVVWVKLIAALVRDDDGEPLYFIAQILDITEQRRSHQLTAWMFEHSPDLMCIADLDGHLVKVNPSWTALLGWTEDELLSVPFASFVHPDDLADTSEEYDSARTAGKGSTRFENRYRDKTGGYRWLQWNSYPFEDEGIIVANARDITDERWRQAELERQRTELARSNEELQHFAYVASHDLRAPLRTISGFAHLIEQDYDHVLDDHGREYVHFLVDGTARMQRMIDDLLAYSRVGNETVRDDGVVSDVLVGLEPSIVEAGAKVTVSPLPAVRANRSQMEVLVQNLVLNALKFHRPGMPPHVDISGAVVHGQPRLVVDDDGIGIPEVSRERVFKMFQRLHSQEQYPGTGLGLAMCKKIATANDGHISVEDSPIGGTRFVIRLPAAPGVP